MTTFIVILLLIGVFVAAAIALSRTTYEVGSARDTEYLELEGNWIRYRVSGGGPPVVLVHGWLTSGRIWEWLAVRLAQRFTVYTLDLSGFGDSDKPISGYGVRNGSRLLYAFCAYFGLTRAAVVGHDVGGAMAAKLAADHPDMVGRIILVATPADENQIDLPTFLWLATLPVVGPVFYTLGRFVKPVRRLWMRPFVLDPEDLTEEVVDDAGKPTPAAVAKTLGVMRREIARGRLVRQAGTIKVPALIVVGEEDQIVDPEAASDWSQALPAEVVLLDRCGHLPMIERTGEFNARVLAFLTDDPRYLDAHDDFPQETEDEAVAETRGEPPPLAYTEPDPAEPDYPPAARQQDDHYPSREREPEGAEDRSDPTEDRSPERSTDAAEDAEERPRNRTDRARNGGNAGVPEIPEDLFEWPDSLKGSRPWNHPRKANRQDPEDPGEDTDPGEPEEEPRP